MVADADDHSWSFEITADHFTVANNLIEHLIAQKLRQVQALQSTFWKRWVKEYLPTLTKRPCWRSHSPNFEEGELVLVQDDDVKRGKWPLGRIVQTFPGKDGVVRSVELKMKDGTLKRSVSKLYKLEDNEE